MSNHQLEIRWKAVAVLANEPAIHRESLLFNKSFKVGLYNQFDIDLSLCYVPILLLPTVTYHQTIRNLLKKQGYIVNNKNFPYDLQIEGLGKCTFNLQIKLYPTSIISFTITVNNITIPNTVQETEQLIEIQSLDKISPISNILDWTLRMVETMSHKKLGPSTSIRSRPGIYLYGSYQGGRFDDYLHNDLSKYIGILIRNRSYQNMRTEIIESIISKNKDQNIKDQNELLLIDKQGLLFATPLTNLMFSQEAFKSRFVRTLDLYEIAMVFREFLDKYYDLRFKNEDFSDFILYKIQSWINEPNVVFTESVSNKHVWNLLINEFELISRLNSITRQNDFTGTVAEKFRYFSQFRTGWWEQSDFTYTLSRTIEETRGLRLDFIGNMELRRMVLEDYQEAKRSLLSRNYKATIVLCGSIAEAILTDVIERAKLPGITTKKLMSDFTLSKLIDTAIENGLLVDKTLIGLLTPLREYRNIIHPGVSIRKSILPDEAKANINLQIINLLVQELRTTVKKSPP